MAVVPPDYTRAIVSSLFSSPPGSTTPPAESFIAYLQTFESVPGQSSRKARFLILSAARDGKLKLHKAKQNNNGTFSIGKTWALEELRAAEVIKRPVEGMSSPQPLTFTLHFAGNKQYRYDTDLPSSLQAAFLVTVVRCWRRYMQGRNQPDLHLIGFQVDSAPAPSSNAAATPVEPSQPRSKSQQGLAQHSNGPPPTSRHAAPTASSSAARPTTAGSNYTTGSRNVSSSSTAQRPITPSGPIDPASSGRRPSVPRSISPNPPPPTSRPPTASSSRTVAPPSSASEHPSASSQPSVAPSDRTRKSSSSSQPGAQATATAAPSNGSIRTELPEGLGASMRAARSRNASIAAPSSSDDNIGPTERSRKGSAGQSVPPVPSSSGGQAVPMGKAAADPSNAALKNATRRPSIEEVVDDETVMANVEEMLEGFEWRGGMGGTASGSGLGKADEIEKRLIGELKALDAASVHAIMESDDRVEGVVKHLDDALAELDKMEGLISLYKSQLNLMTDDIAHIEGQNRGLQVQTSNQRMLLAELDKLMSTINIPEADLAALSQESLESAQGIERLEKAAVSLYKALLSTRDTSVGDMAVASEHLEEYRAKASQFSKRIFDFLAIMFKFQVDQVLNPKEKTASDGQLPSHDTLEDFLGRYCGLMLFVKEIDQSKYQQICAAYFTAIGDLHRREIHALMGSLRGQVKKPSEEELEASFSSVKESPTLRQQSIRRAGTLVRSPLESGKKDKDGKYTGSEAFGRALSDIVPHVLREQGFVADFLHINPIDQSITFADYMVLEAFFRRSATTYLASQQSKRVLKDIKGAMEVIFGFLEYELRDWLDAVLLKDNMQIVGILAALDRFVLQSEKARNEFLTRTLQKQYQRLCALLDRSIKEQVKSIEQTKLTIKKRKGVAPFVRVFPSFVSRVEAQLNGADALNVRQIVNGNYERITAAIMDCLQQMAKMDGEAGHAGEAKDQLNYHVILIENMHHVIAVFGKERVPALASFVTQAKEKYSQNLEAYIRLVLRRPLARVLDYFAGLEQLLRTTPPTEVSLHAAYTKMALRRVLSDLRAKDLRKAVDALYKRVDKHFGAEPGDDVARSGGEVLKTVWTACEDETQRLVGVWRGLLSKCYPDDKVGFEFGKAEVHEYFVKAQSQ